MKSVCENGPTDNTVVFDFAAASASPESAMPTGWRKWSKVVVISPHSDDAAFSLAGTLHILSRYEIPIEIITCFSRSEYTQSVPPLSREDATPLRKAEDLRFGNMLGQHCVVSWLDQLDAPLRGYHSDEICSFGPIPEHEKPMAAEIWCRIRERLAVDCAVFAPLGLGKHIDHCIARHAVIPLIHDAALSVFFYEELPYAAFYSIHDNQQAAMTLASEISGTAILHVLSGPGLKKIKNQAVGCYKSQKESTLVGCLVDNYGDLIMERAWEVSCNESK